jgi:hypothetical protein
MIILSHCTELAAFHEPLHRDSADPKRCLADHPQDIVCKHKQTKHAYKVNFSRATHICKKFLYPAQNEKPMDVTTLLARELIPIQNERQYARLKKLISESRNILYTAHPKSK